MVFPTGADGGSPSTSRKFAHPPPPTGKNFPSRLNQIFIPRPPKVNSPPPTPPHPPPFPSLH